MPRRLLVARAAATDDDDADDDDARAVPRARPSFAPARTARAATRARRRWTSRSSRGSLTRCSTAAASAAECDEVRELAAKRLEPSGLALRKGERRENMKNIRTSSGTFLASASDPSGTLERIEARIADVTHVHRDHGEPFNVLRYRPGEKYDSHYDTFDPASYGPQVSQRVASVLLYLTDVEEGGRRTSRSRAGRGSSGSGGGTSITRRARGIAGGARAGGALLFWNVHPNATLDKRALHGGARSCAGRSGSRRSGYGIRAFGEGEGPARGRGRGGEAATESGTRCSGVDARKTRAKRILPFRTSSRGGRPAAPTTISRAGATALARFVIHVALVRRALARGPRACAPVDSPLALSAMSSSVARLGALAACASPGRSVSRRASSATPRSTAGRRLGAVATRATTVPRGAARPFRGVSSAAHAGSPSRGPSTRLRASDAAAADASGGVRTTPRSPPPTRRMRPTTNPPRKSPRFSSACSGSSRISSSASATTSS